MNHFAVLSLMHEAPSFIPGASEKLRAIISKTAELGENTPMRQMFDGGSGHSITPRHWKRLVWWRTRGLAAMVDARLANGK
jgi:hypothetical protein